jgi:hypothetical protein
LLFFLRSKCPVLTSAVRRTAIHRLHDCSSSNICTKRDVVSCLGPWLFDSEYTLIAFDSRCCLFCTDKFHVHWKTASVASGRLIGPHCRLGTQTPTNEMYTRPMVRRWIAVLCLFWPSRKSRRGDDPLQGKSSEVSFFLPVHRFEPSTGTNLLLPNYYLVDFQACPLEAFRKFIRGRRVVRSDGGGTRT